jgi:hypothetical protein
MRPVSQRLRAVVSEVVTPLFAEMRDETSRTLRAELVEVQRMLRQQGDAADEVAETLGRTLVRLSSEIEALSAAIDRLDANRQTTGPAAEVAAAAADVSAAATAPAGDSPS